MKPKNSGAVLITGATEGIGYELSKLFAKDGYDLVLVARNTEKLNKMKDNFWNTHGISVHIVPKDLSKRESADEIYADVKEAGIDVGILVNNAGYNVYGYFSEMDFSDVDDMFQVLVRTPTRLTSLFVQDMKRKNRGKIMFVASIAAGSVSPYFSIYSGSKAFMVMFAKSIAAELADYNISVTAFCPGYTKTQFAFRAKFDNTLAVKLGAMNADKVAKIGYDGLMENKVYVVPGLFNKVFATAMKVVPWSIQARAGKFIAGQPETRRTRQK